jgi:HK97 family phage major capsid protein
MEETTFTNSAAEASEGGTYAESTLALTEQTSNVRKIATFLPVTDEQLDDVEQVQGYVDNRLAFMLRQRLDLQLLVGDGVAPNLEGINNVTGILTQAKGGDPTFDAVYKAGRQIRVTGRAMPNIVIAHPNDWEDIRLTRTADGIYILGNPADAGPERLFGWRVAQSDAQTENTILVGDTMFTELATRRGVEIQVSNSHSTFFIEGKQAIRADMRVAFIVYRAEAWCTVTGV